MKKRAFALALTCALACLSLTGCGREEALPRPALAVVVGNTACSKGLDLNSPLLRDLTYDCVRGYGRVSVINADGDSELAFSVDYDLEEQKKKASRAMLDHRARAESDALLAALGGVMADSPEVDYLEALRLGARSLSASEDCDVKTLVMVGTGLSTQSDVLNFRNGLLSGDPEVVVEQLREKNAIPDLSGITVIAQQLGDVALPQPSLSQTQLLKLREIWGGIVEAGNGAFVCNTVMPVSADPNAEYPAMSLVELPAETPIRFPQASLDEAAFDAPLALEEEQVRFAPDSAQLLEPEKAAELLRPLASYMLQDRPELELLLVGSIAGDACDERGVALSEERAEAVRQLLLRAGVPAGRLRTVGLGCSAPWQVYGAGVEGPAAVQNRRVVLLDASSRQALEILAAL